MKDLSNVYNASVIIIVEKTPKTVTSIILIYLGIA